jgi:hypothetical protein
VPNSYYSVDRQQNNDPLDLSRVGGAVQSTRAIRLRKHHLQSSPTFQKIHNSIAGHPWQALCFIAPAQSTAYPKGEQKANI